MDEFHSNLYWALNEHINQIPGYDPSYELVYYNSWSTYEEHGWLAILLKNGQYFELTGGYSVMGEGPQHDEWILELLNDENQALESMLDFDSIVDSIPVYD